MSLMTPPRSVSPPEGIWATHGPLHLALASPPAKGSWEQFHLARVHPQMAILPGKMKENKIYPSKSSIVSDKPNFASRIQSTLRSWRQCSAGGPGPKISTRTLWEQNLTNHNKSNIVSKKTSQYPKFSNVILHKLSYPSGPSGPNIPLAKAGSTLCKVHLKKCTGAQDSPLIIPGPILGNCVIWSTIIE